MTQQLAHENSVFALAEKLGVPIDAIRIAWGNALQLKNNLRDQITESGLLTGGDDSDRSFVVFGSLSRNEFTGEGRSDIDWALLVDGLAAIQDIDLVHSLTHLVEASGQKKPNKAGPFGNLAFSHDLIHQIGGPDDTNINTTQRLLLLLESSALYGEAVRSRVIRNVLARYVLEDESFLAGTHPEHVPRFLLNDVARYWRTMTVDFQTKKRERENAGFAIRNVKLRFSRKLLYLAGLITCFSFSIWADDENQIEAWEGAQEGRAFRLISYLERIANSPPLELVARAFLHLNLLDDATRTFLTSYNDFVALLSNSDRRGRLEALKPEEMARDQVYQEARIASHEFQHAIEKLFLEPERSVLSRLTIRYGVF
jgi:hypothetical protein